MCAVYVNKNMYLMKLKTAPMNACRTSTLAMPGRAVPRRAAQCHVTQRRAAPYDIK